jgi:Ni,Fe-hydrogenase maturation factor
MREDANQCIPKDIDNMITKLQRMNGGELLIRKKDQCVITEIYYKRTKLHRMNIRELLMKKKERWENWKVLNACCGLFSVMREDANQCRTNEIDNMITKLQIMNGRELLMRKNKI